MPPAARRVFRVLLVLLPAAGALAGCGEGGLQAGGQYSGVPDSTFSAGRANGSTGSWGSMSTSGVATSNREVPSR